MSRQLYRGKILEHYKEPRNFGAVEAPDLESEVANPHCGDELHFTARTEGGNLEELRFEGEGCALSTASASMLTQRVGQQPLGEAGEIADGDVFDMLGIQKDEVAPIRVKCVLLAKEGVEKLVEDYEQA